MAGLLGWIKSKAISVLDPDAEKRVNEAARIVELQIKAQRDAFDFHKTLDHLSLYPEDRPHIAAKVYESFLQRAWKDFDLSLSDENGLKWVAKHLFLAPERKVELDKQAVLDAFRVAFRTCANNATGLNDSAIQLLHRIADRISSTPAAILINHYRNDVQLLCRGLLTKAITNGAVNVEAWELLKATLASLQVPDEWFRSLVRPEGKSIVESALTSAKADGVITVQEKNQIDWLLQNLVDDAKWTSYVQQELARLQYLNELASGHLPSLKTDYAGLRAGEIVHLLQNSVYARVRKTQHETRTEQIPGTLIITDWRMLFVGATLTLDVNHRRIISLRRIGENVEVKASSKGSGFYNLRPDPEAATIIFELAVKKANQTFVHSQQNTPDRHIPRDIRQRVWQQYGGKCAECGSTQYLEFDHIVPVARGGGNTEKNVQLLCRGCNGKKSDHI